MGNKFVDNISLINETCKLMGIDKITPDNIDLEDQSVWDSIRDDTTSIFQMESSFAQQTSKALLSDEVLSKIREHNPDMSLLKLFAFANALIRPCGNSVRDNVCKGIIHKTGVDEIDKLLQEELYLCIIQEDIMRFLMGFCGYDLSGADNARRVIGKKGDTTELIPEIKQGFYENAVPRFNLTTDEAEGIIQPILRCILDAKNYAFSWNHAVPYSYIGYACGYLRTKHPLEFLTTCLNVYIPKEEKTTTIIKYMNRVGIPLIEPKFRHARAKYSYDTETNSIYKGIHSIKYLNESSADDLYALRHNKYNTFMDLLKDIAETSVNARQLEILIKLDFFSEFGNPKELLAINDFFIKFKQGKAKSMSKGKLNDDILENIIKRFSRETDKTYSLIDTMSICREIERYLKSLHIADFSYKSKIEDQLEYLGYINLRTDPKNMEERRKLIILDIRPLKSKEKGNIWGYSVKTQSIGSGVNGEFTIFSRVYNKNPINKMDIIYLSEWSKKVSKNGQTYHYIDGYRKI